MRVKLLADYGEGDGKSTAGATIEVEDAVGTALIAGKIAEQTTTSPNEVIAEILKGLRDDLHETVKALVTDALGVKDGAHIEVGDTLEDPKGGFKSFGHFATDIWKAGRNGLRASKELIEYATKVAGEASEGDAGQGGYLVPVEFRATLLQKPLEDSIVLPRATVLPMQTNVLTIPFVNETTHVGSVHGGITPARTPEATQKDKTKPTFGQVTLTLHDITGLVYVSDQLLEDSPISIEPLFNKLFTDAITFQADDDYLFGTGVAMSLGAFLGPDVVVQAIEAAQPAATIVIENIIKMWTRMNPRGMGSAIWLINPGVFPQLATMALNVGAGGAPAYLPANGVAAAPFGTLMGRPLVMTEHMQALGTQGDIGLADFREYLIGQKGGIKAASSIHLRFDYDQTVFRFVLRTDGRSWWPAPMTPLRGGATQTYSPFVVLGDRP